MLGRRITLFCDQQDSFFLEYVGKAEQIVTSNGDTFRFASQIAQIEQGEILIAAAAKSILGNEILELNKHNVILHPSKLPLYRGSGVVAWSILDGANELWVTSFLANQEVDLGPIVWQSSRALNGTELMDEIRDLQAALFLEHIRYVIQLPEIIGEPQVTGNKSKIYRRRTADDSRLDLDKSLRDQFNLLRVVDNSRYPAFFVINGKKYILCIYDENMWESN